MAIPLVSLAVSQEQDNELMVGHKGQEKTGEHQHDLSCPYCPLWLNFPLLLFVAKFVN